MEDESCNDIFGEIVEKANEYLMEDLDDKAKEAIEKAIMDILNKYANGKFAHTGPIFINEANSGTAGYIDSETPRGGKVLSPNFIEEILRRKMMTPANGSGSGLGSANLGSTKDISDDSMHSVVLKNADSEVITNEAISPTNQPVPNPTDLHNNGSNEDVNEGKDDASGKNEKERRKRFFLFGKRKDKDRVGDLDPDEAKKTKVDKFIEKEDAVNARLNKLTHVFLNQPGIAQIGMARNMQQTLILNNDQRPIPVVLVNDVSHSKSRQTKKKEKAARIQKLKEEKEAELKNVSQNVKPKDQKSGNKERDVLELVENVPVNQPSQTKSVVERSVESAEEDVVEDVEESKDDSWSQETSQE